MMSHCLLMSTSLSSGPCASPLLIRWRRTAGPQRWDGAGVARHRSSRGVHYIAVATHN